MIFSKWLVSLTALAALPGGGISLAQNGGSVVYALQRAVALPLLGDIFVACLIVFLMGVGAVVSVAWYIVETLTRPKRHDQFIPLTPYALGLPAEAVSFPCKGGAHDVRGLYIPSPGATSTVLICPGYRRSLTNVLVICKHVWEAGHSVLAFEYYGHGLPVGATVTLGYREIDDFLGAVAYATVRAPAARLGAIGFSMGAASAIMACTQTQKVEAVVADSGFATQWSAVEVAVRKALRVDLPAWAFGALYRATDLLLAWRVGYHFSQVEPVREIGRITPRPVLIIHGLLDRTVDPHDAVRLYEAAGEPKELWLIPACGHTRGYFADEAEYSAKITTFFAQHLLKERTQNDDTRRATSFAQGTVSQAQSKTGGGAQAPVDAEHPSSPCAPRDERDQPAA